MKDSVKQTFWRFCKHTAFSLFGTGTDMLVVWICSHYILKGSYVGESVLSPIISFECANIVNFLISSHWVWGDKMKGKSLKSYFKHFLAYNASYTTVLLLRLGFIQLLKLTVDWDMVICNFIAMTFAGIVNFIMNDRVIFRNRKKEETPAA